MNSFVQPFKRCRPALGTLLTVTLHGVDWETGARVTHDIFGDASRLEKTFSLFDPESELAGINRRRSTPLESLSSDLKGLLKLGHEIEIRSAGAFRLMPQASDEEGPGYELNDERVTRHGPWPFDLGGIAKGYILDRLYEKLRRQVPGHECSVNAGGDLRTSFTEIVEVRIPAPGDEARFHITLPGQALATSSRQGSLAMVGRASARFFEVPENHRHALSATVMATSCAAADALTKVALHGPLDPADFEDLGVLSVWRFDSEGSILPKRVSGFP